jgi:CrcB protein
VGLGSALGGIARYLVSAFIQHRSGSEFPLGTLVVNLTGSLLMGFLVRWALASPAVTAEVRALLTTGFCGGYTTFSTYSFETMTLVEDGDYRRAALYAVASVALALLGTTLGFSAARQLITLRGQS